MLPERPPWVQDWDALSDDERRVYARFQEVFAGFLTHTDAQIGRVVSFLEEIGELDNTLVMLVSDNGTSAEGGLTGTFNDRADGRAARASERARPRSAGARLRPGASVRRRRALGCGDGGAAGVARRRRRQTAG